MPPPVDTAPAVAPPPGTLEIRVPAGLRLPMKLVSATDAKKSLGGDPLVARLAEDVHLDDHVFPAGSEAHGTIRSLHCGKTGLCDMELSFTDLRTPNELVKFRGVMERIEKRKGVALGNLVKSAERQVEYKPDELQVEPKYFNLAELVFTYRTLAYAK